VKGLISLAKAKPRHLTYGSGGHGNITHLAMELFSTMAGIEMVHVPYKVAAPSIIGLVSGEVHTLFSPVASALARAHSRGIVHRDVQPSNLFLQQTPNGPFLRVLDFGVAKILDDEGAGDNTKSITKAPYYAAPEVFEPRFGKAGPWTDVYQLALVLIEALRDQPARRDERTRTSRRSSSTSACLRRGRSG
jgi:serine/threonine protein kinase